jgi:hypothetical protein
MKSARARSTSSRSCCASSNQAKCIPIGETHPQRVDVRIIAATNADVETLVSQGRFGRTCITA